LIAIIIGIARIIYLKKIDENALMVAPDRECPSVFVIVLSNKEKLIILKQEPNKKPLAMDNSRRHTQIIATITPKSIVNPLILLWSCFTSSKFWSIPVYPLFFISLFCSDFHNLPVDSITTSCNP